MHAIARLDRYLMLVSGLALAVIVLLTVADVLSTSLRGRPILGAYEIVETALVFLVFLGLPETFRSEQNITVDLADHFVEPRYVNYLRAAGAMMCVAYLSLLLWSMVGPARDAYRFGDFKADSGIPFMVLWAPILFGTALAVVASLAVMWKVLAERREG